jgi:hypothetical protein
MRTLGHKKGESMRVKHVFLIVFIILSTISCQDHDEVSLPSWVVGIWEGGIGYEHDPITYNVKIDLRDSNNMYTMSLIDEGVKFELVVESASSDKVRFQLKPIGNVKNLLFNGGVIDLVKVSNSPDSLIHTQFYPLNTTQLWLGQLNKAEK